MGVFGAREMSNECHPFKTLSKHAKLITPATQDNHDLCISGSLRLLYLLISCMTSLMQWQSNISAISLTLHSARLQMTLACVDQFETLIGSC